MKYLTHLSLLVLVVKGQVIPSTSVYLSTSNIGSSYLSYLLSQDDQGRLSTGLVDTITDYD